MERSLPKDIEEVLRSILNKEELEESKPTLRDQCITYLLSLYGPSQQEIVDYYKDNITYSKDG